MTNSMVVNAYADFKPVIDSMLAKSNVFYYWDGSSTFRALALAEDMSYVIFLTGLTSVPGSFNTDFPSAVQTATVITTPSDIFQV